MKRRSKKKNSESSSRQRGSKEKNSENSSRQIHHVGETLSSEANYHIPFDPIVEILSKQLPLRSLVRFQCVSKLWLSLTIDLIKTRLTQPRLLIIISDRLLKSSVFSSSTYPLNTNKNLISSDDCQLTRGFNSILEYQYVRGLICCYSRSGQLEIYNPTTRQSLLLPLCHSTHRFFGYDPVENQYKLLCLPEYSCLVFTSLEGSVKQKWRKLNTRGIRNRSPQAVTSTGLCIDGIVYYISKLGFCELVTFDVRLERFDTIQMPEVLKLNYLKKMTLVNYRGKLGCISRTTSTAEIWIMEKNREWSKITLFMSPTQMKTLKYSHCVAGVTRDGEIVIMPKTLDSEALKLLAYYYDPKDNTSRSVEFEVDSTLKREFKSQMRVCVFSVPDHFENTMSLF